ncbi:hypothetical protein BU23DRAFT_578050 [Bimuria novae-zelandiae CBS 107.79]|uniref:Rhodopsin domain-containing protein n=1 Tax=Bimuria novae-zelandiae CBS 107.79 TaxID=1447943 RepID=A0A6A5VLK1_9PLEO|nr:hypothetical protein BU23DRAFT_578050 [Bimuria novae-zelandiae CBS 107.79]
MLGVIPECAVQCVMHTVFAEGGCPLSNAGALAQCACTDPTIQAHLSAYITAFADSLYEAYPKETRVSELKTIATTTIALSVPFLMIRLYSRWLKNGRLWSDDGFAIIAAVFLIAVSSIILRMSLMAENGPELLKMFYVCQMLYVLVQVFAKVAILVLYSRLFPDFIMYFQWTVRFMIAFMFTQGTVFFLLVTFQCLPISSIWNKTIEGHCLPISAVIGFTGDGLSDELWNLQMSTKKKIGLVLILGVGSFVIRLKFVLKYANTYDATWDNVDVLKWSLIELLSACICGNLMPLRPLIGRPVPGIRSAFSWYSRRSRNATVRQGVTQNSRDIANATASSTRVVP